MINGVFYIIGVFLVKCLEFLFSFGGLIFLAFCYKMSLN